MPTAALSPIAIYGTTNGARISPFRTFYADNETDLTGMGVTKEVYSGLVNLLYQATPQLRFGMEYQHSRREIEAGDSGNMDRLQFSTIYAF